jgi:hypothetical protein
MKHRWFAHAPLFRQGAKPAAISGRGLKLSPGIAGRRLFRLLFLRFLNLFFLTVVSLSHNYPLIYLQGGRVEVIRVQIFRLK